MAQPKQAAPKPMDTPSEVSLDFSGVKPFEPLDESNPDGTPKLYLSRITNMTMAKGKEAPMIVTELTIEKPEGDAKRKLFRNFSTSPKALPFLYGLFKAANPEVELGENFRLKIPEWIGLTVAHTVKNESYKNNMGEEATASRIERVYPKTKYVD